MGRANLGYAGYGWQDSLTKQFENHLSENMNDRINHTLDSLKKSKFRSKFKLSQKDRDYIAAKSLETIRDHAYQFINSRVAPAFPKNDGKQTPMKGHPVFIAQHGTATCCRKCIQKWHGIGKGKVLNAQEVDFIVVLIMGWIEVQIIG
jgi:hypothetical protein